MGQARSANERPQWLGEVAELVHELLHGVAPAMGREESRGGDGDHDDQHGGGSETEAPTLPARSLHVPAITAPGLSGPL